MIRYTSKEMKIFCGKKFPNKTFEESINKLKSDYHVTVLNKGHSKRKSYLVCESIIS